MPPGIDLHKDLITVPSCDVHNSDKSKDDEYLLYVIVSNYETSPVAQHHFSTKLRLSIKKRPAIAAFFRNGQTVKVDGQDTWMFFPDEQRLDRTLKLVAKAIHYHHYGRKWRAPQHIIVPPFLRVRAAQSAEYAANLARVESQVSTWFKHETKHGKNPQVFYYQLRPGASSRDLILRMVFYGFFSWISMDSRVIDKAKKQLIEA